MREVSALLGPLEHDVSELQSGKQPRCVRPGGGRGSCVGASGPVFCTELRVLAHGM